MQRFGNIRHTSGGVIQDQSRERFFECILSVVLLLVERFFRHMFQIELASAGSLKKMDCFQGAYALCRMADSTVNAATSFSAI